MARVAAGASVSGVNGAVDDSAAAAATAQTGVATALTDFDTAGADAVTALGVITYSSTTHQFSGTFVSGPSPTAANLNTLITALNAALTALLAVKTDLANIPVTLPDLVVSIDTTKIKDRSQAFRFARHAVKFLGVTG